MSARGARVLEQKESTLKTLNRRHVKAALERVEPRPLLLAPRVLRRVIRHHYAQRGVTMRVPRHKSFVVDRDTLRAAASRREVGESATALPERVIIVVEPDEERLRRGQVQSVLHFYWRHVYRAQVELALREQVEAGALTKTEILRFATSIGQIEMDEIQSVLAEERRLQPPRNETETFIAFAATFLELEAFAPVLIQHTFPALTRPAFIRKHLDGLIDPDALLEQSRPEGASNPDRAAQLEFFNTLASEPPPLPGRPPRPDAGRARALRDDAITAQKVGNDVRAAILTRRAAGHLERVGDEGVEELVSEAREHLEHLCQRLVIALGSDNSANAWLAALLPTLEPAARGGLRSVESRLLYDLQKVCLDEEEEIYAVGVVEWVLSLGRRKLTRPLPSQREVLVVKHLRHAMRRASRLRIGEDAAKALRDCLRSALHKAEHDVRGAFQGLIEAALHDAGLDPQNRPEQIAARKLIEELLDRVVERGFLTIGDVRDAISRNGLKLPNLTLRDAVTRDPLLKLNRNLTTPLDGVYRPGEIYMRGLQRFSALVFGTPLGRLLTLYLILPFGGAFVVLAGLQHTLGVLIHKLTGVEPAISTNLSIVLGGIIAFALIHSELVRKTAWEATKACGRALRTVFWTWPLQFFRLPWVRRIFESSAWRVFSRMVLRPSLFSGLCVLAFWGLARPDPGVVWTWFIVGQGVFACLLLLPIGRMVEEAFVDWLLRNWEHVQHHLLPGLIRWMMDFFKAVTDGVERLLYKVDEWLRFRRGEPRVRKIIKGALGTVWFFVTYVVRFYVNLLIEPQINPVKHFPVVTVSHKLMIPMLPTLAALLAQPLMPLGPVIAQAFAWSTVTVLPGIAGFLVWEFKENWKLYDANRPEHLQPELIGHHGESMLKFMKPGFHSGTLPKLYRKLRRAEARSLSTGDLRRARRLQDDLHHVAESIHRFVDREFAYLLGALPIHVHHVQLAASRVTVLVEHRDEPGLLHIRFEEQSGWLLAHVHEAGWVDTLDDSTRARVRAAIAGLYHKSGVDFVRNHLETLFPPPLHYDIADAGLLVWPADHAQEARYDINGRSNPILRRGAEIGPEAITRRALIFSRRPLPYLRWVAIWAKVQPELLGFDDLRLLPEPRDTSSEGADNEEKGEEPCEDGSSSVELSSPEEPESAEERLKVHA